MKSLLALFSCCLLTACATSPLPTSLSKPTQAILNSSLVAPKESAGKLIVKRDPGFVGSACNIRVLINGQPLADLAPGEVVTAYLEPNEYIVGAVSTGVCGGGDAEAPLRIKLGESRTYRISIDQGMSIKIGPTAFQ